MKKRKYLNRFAVLFLAFMLFFTLFGERLYEQTLPKVVTTKAKEKEFPVTVFLEDGTEYTATKKELAVPAYVLEGNSVFVLEDTPDGYLVRERVLELGAEAEQWFEIVNGLGKQDKIVLAADRPLKDGMRVLRVEIK